jgi:hypothetical protein
VSRYKARYLRWSLQVYVASEQDVEVCRSSRTSMHDDTGTVALGKVLRLRKISVVVPPIVLDKKGDNSILM